MESCLKGNVAREGREQRSYYVKKKRSIVKWVVIGKGKGFLSFRYCRRLWHHVREKPFWPLSFYLRKIEHGGIVRRVSIFRKTRCTRNGKIDRAICVGGQGLQILSSDEFATIFQYIFFFNTFRDLNYCLLNRKETWFIFENFFENYMKSNVLSLWAHELLAEACNETHFCGCLVLFVSY